MPHFKNENVTALMNPTNLQTVNTNAHWMDEKGRRLFLNIAANRMQEMLGRPVTLEWDEEIDRHFWRAVHSPDTSVRVADAALHLGSQLAYHRLKIDQYRKNCTLQSRVLPMQAESKRGELIYTTHTNPLYEKFRKDCA